MIFRLLSRIFGNKNDRRLKRIASIVDSIALLESKVKIMTDYELMNQTSLFRSRFKEGESLDALLPEAYATVRESSLRVLGMRHYDVQILGGIILHMGKIAEMKTGEGKTLVATLPVYLNAIAGCGVHVITVNDYLAVRDTIWMGKLYNFLGMTVGTLKQGITDEERKKAYNSDITYGTNNEFGFDYLRDNMKFNSESLMQRDLYYAIVDEVDSILIDEARTPLIISGEVNQVTDLYQKVNGLVSKLKLDIDYSLDEKSRTVSLTERGVFNVEKYLDIKNLYELDNVEILHHVNIALRAQTLFKRDIDYIVKNDQVIIVDEFTGRLMPGRRYGDGLHQAIEAKERVEIEKENQTFATITFQNYFRMYSKLAGMTGTADTEASEFKKIYNLDVTVIPTNKPMIRNDLPDLIYKKREEKFQAIIKDIKKNNKIGQPVLVGTVSVDSSEKLSRELEKQGVKHFVLNAKNHEKEAEIIALAGQKSAVTISTNMAGRGTDIVLGDGVIDLGGLHVIGTERHESRRIDNQLRGRSGRQGDPGSSRFYLSLEDDLLRIFGGDRITTIMEKLGMNNGEPIEHKLISRSIERAQSRVESHNFDVRKHLLEYDNVLNQQREIIYKQRRDLLLGKNLEETLKNIMLEKSSLIVDKCFEERTPIVNLKLSHLNDIFFKELGFKICGVDEYDFSRLNREEISKLIFDKMFSYYTKKELLYTPDKLREMERIIMLQLVDSFWKEHLLNMDHLKEGIGLRGYAQQNPLLIYKKEGFDMFQDMIFSIKNETIKTLFKIKIDWDDNKQSILKDNSDKFIFSNQKNNVAKKKTMKRSGVKIGRNSICPCGSNKKYKKCCGK